MDSLIGNADLQSARICTWLQKQTESATRQTQTRASEADIWSASRFPSEATETVVVDAMWPIAAVRGYIFFLISLFH